MKRLTILALLLASCGLASCGPSDGGSLGPAPTGVPVAPATASPSTEPLPTPQADPTHSVTVQVWFTRAGKVFPTKRTRPHTVATSGLALTELIAGPSTVELAAGVSTTMFSHTTFDIVGISDGVATVSFPELFYNGDRAAVRMRQAQVVYTLTQFSKVSKVGLQSAGKPVAAPVGRADYADLLPRILVLSPVIGQHVTSPIAVSGSADVREATVNVRVLDGVGRQIATRFTTATCGSGCRGDYSLKVAYRLCGEQPGTVEVYEVSGEDGSRVQTVAIPVIFGPC